MTQNSALKWITRPWGTAALLAGAALLLRLWALDWGLPLKHAHIDESVVVFYALRVVAGDPNPQVFFDYPSLFLYVLAAAFQAVILAGKALGAVASTAQALDTYLQGDPTLFTLTARGLNAVLGTLTVVWVYRLGQRMGNPLAAVTAAGLLAVNRLHVLHSHYGTADVIAVFLSLLALERILVYWEKGELRAGGWGAFVIGLAAAAKYYPGLLALALLPAPFFLRLKKPWRFVLLFALLSAAGFCLGSPYSLLAPQRFFERFAHLFPKIVWQPERQGAVFLWPTLKNLLQNGGIVTCALGFWGLWQALRGENRPWKVLGGVFLGFLLFFGFWTMQSEHYALFCYPLLFLLAGLGASRSARFHKWIPAGAALVLAALALGPTVRQLRVMSAPDTRLRALEWVRTHAPAGSRLLRFAHTPEFTRRDPYQVLVDWENKRLAGDFDPAALSREGPFDFILYGTYDPGADPVLERLKNRLSLAAKVEGPAPRFPHHPAVYIFKPS